MSLAAGTYGGGWRTPFASAWSWWTRPRAVSAGGVVYVGSTDRKGAVIVDEWPNASTVRARHTISALEGEQDDHNNPALVLQPGREPLVFYSRHDKDEWLHYRKGTAPFVAGADLGTFGTEGGVSFASFDPGRTTYALAFVHGEDIYVWTRGGPWGFTKSTDWGDTWTAPLSVFASGRPLYVAIVLVGDTLRCAMSNHPTNTDPPDQNVYYAEVDLLTGDVTTAGVAVANINTGVNLPLAIETLDVVAAPPVAGYRTWVYDVSAGPNPEVSWLSFDEADYAGTSMYHYSAVAGGVWETHDIVAAGGTFEPGTQPYFGGAQFSAPGDLLVSRLDAGTWHLERKVTADGGATWTTTPLASQTAAYGQALVRAFPVEQADAVARPFDWAANFTQDFAAFTRFAGNVGGSRL